MMKNKPIFLCFAVFAGAALLSAAGVSAETMNIARGCPYTFSSRPSYGLCTDAGDVAPGGHAVVRVAPGGDAFRVLTLSADDESMTVLGERHFRSKKYFNG